MSSMRGAYKAKLREGSNSSIASRRKSKGAERKNSRYEEISKRRLLSNDMSPVVEQLDVESSLKNKPLRMRDANRKKGDTVLDRLKQWREEKKLQKGAPKVKPMFKIGSALDRKSEAELFAGKAVFPKPKENKAPPLKAVPVVKNKPKVNVSVDIGCKDNFTKTVGRSKNEKHASKLEVKRSVPAKNQPTKIKDTISTGTSKSLRATKSSVDLASKLTVAAAAKRNDLKASPKKFLRATRATTLQKKELLENKKGSKIIKGSFKSTGKLLRQQKKNDASVTDAACHKEFIDFKPLVVPRLLESFNFSAMDNGLVNDKESSSSTNSAQDHEISNVLETETCTKMQLKSKRKSVRKSSRLAALEMNDEETAIQSLPETDSFDNLKSKRKSIHKSSQLASLGINNVDDAAIVSVPENESFEHIKSKRKSTRMSKRLSHLETNSINTGVLSVPHDLITFTPGLPKSVRKSKCLSSSVAKQRKCPIESDLSGIAHSTHNFASLTPKLSKRKSIRASTTTKKLEDLQISTPNKDFISEINSPKSSNVVSNKSLLSCSPKNLQKSNALEAAENKSNDCNSLLSGIELITEEDMEIGAVQGTVSDVDTQIPLIDVTSTPKSAHSSRKSMWMDSLSVSNVEISSSPEKNLTGTRTPKPNPRCSRGARRSLSMRRGSRMSSATPAKTPRFDGKDLNVSGAATPNSVRNIENIPRSNTSRRSARKSTVISVSDEGTAVGRDLELALAYTVENPPLSAKASRILKELVIEKVGGEKSFFEVSFDESLRESRNTSVNCPDSKLDNTSSNEKMQSISTGPFTPRRSDELTVSTNGLNSLTTPKSVSRTRHSLTSSGFKEPGLPLSAVRSASHRRRRTECSTPSKTPEQMISILKKSPMVEMARRRSRHVSSPAPQKGQYFRDLVHDETKRLSEFCNKWNSLVMGEPDLREEVLGQIRSTVGKALLLIEQRFKQFTGLVDNYVYDLGEKETTPTDLQGFWDMIYFQVEDVDSQFKQLEVLKQSNWQMKTASPKVKVSLKKKTVPKGKVKSKGVKSNFAAFRAEMLKKKAAQGKPGFQEADEDNVETVDDHC